METVGYVLETIWSVVKTFAEIYWKMAYDWPVGTLFAIPITIILLIVLGIVVYGLFTLLDKQLGFNNIRKGIVVGMSYTPAHTECQSTYNIVLNMPTVEQVYYNDRWSVKVKIANVGDAWMDVSERFYRSVFKGQKVKADYRIGCFTGKIYLNYLETA